MHRIAPRLFATVTIAFAFLLQPVTAHEFWIEPARAGVSPGEKIEAELKVGRMLSGEAHPFLSDRFERFTVTVSGYTRPVHGIDGNLPSVSVMTDASGLHVLAHQTIPFRATYTEWDLFGQFLEEEDFPEIAAEHRTRGLNPFNFAERYIRYAKALIPVGEIANNAIDQPLGLEFEIVAENLPFAPENESIRVQLLRSGAPVAHRRVSLFHNNGAKPAERLVFESDANGRVELPLFGGGMYLISSVMIDPVDAPPVAWQSHWASLTFQLD